MLKLEFSFSSMLEPEKCPSEVNFWCSSMLDARCSNARCKQALKNRQILAKIVHFQSNTREKARSCGIFKCSSMLELEFWFSSMLDPAQYSNFHFQACSSPLDARFFHTRCNTSNLYIVFYGWKHLWATMYFLPLCKIYFDSF